MPLQNRVTPFGAIESTPARGLLMGNRGGQIHDPVAKTLTRRRWASKHWIICVTSFKRRWRPVMGPGSYTELFFLDEATALAAGHRPCYECQRQRALQYADAFAKASNRDRVYAGEMDTILHGERGANGSPRLWLSSDEVAELPDGSAVADGDASFVLHGETLRPWSHQGYGPPVPIDRIATKVRLLTPPATVAAIRAGFTPHIHPSAKA